MENIRNLTVLTMKIIYNSSMKNKSQTYINKSARLKNSSKKLFHCSSGNTIEPAIRKRIKQHYETIKYKLTYYSILQLVKPTTNKASVIVSA